MTTEQENKIANDWLLNYHDKLESYQMMLNNFKTLGAMEYSGMPGGTTVGNPTLNKAMSLIDMEEYKNWLMVIEKVELTLSPKMLNFLRVWRNAVHNAKSEGGRPGWYLRASNEYCEWFEKEYGTHSLPNRDTMNEWKNKLINITARLAIRNKLL